MEAIGLTKKALSVSKEVLGEKDSDTVVSYCNLRVHCLSICKMGAELRILKKTDICAGLGHCHVVQSCNKAGMAQFKKCLSQIKRSS